MGDKAEQENYKWRGRRRLGPVHELEILVIAFLLAGAGTYYAVQDLTGDRPFQSFVETAGCVAALVAAHVIFGLLLVQRSWEDTPKAHDPGTEEKPRFRAAFAWMFFFLTVLSWASFGNGNGALSFPWDFELSGNTTNQAIFGVLLGAAFLPLLFGFHLVAIEATENTGRSNYLSDPDEEVGWVTICVTFGVAAFVTVGAWAAGRKLFTMSDNFGLIALAVVVAGFLVFIIAANVLGFREPREPEGAGRRPRKTLTSGVGTSTSAVLVGFDAALVRLVAPLSGATLPGLFSAKIAIVLVMLPLSALGFALPAPMGLAPIGFAILLILAVGRRWAWVEDDREKALRLQTTRSDKFRIGFNNDMRDEALLGYAFLFVLVPLGLRQIQLQFGFFGGPQPDVPLDAVHSADIVAWLNFFGGELAKGVPIVDWFDIYGIQQDRPFEPTDENGRHIIFGSRLLIDIVIIAALFQAIGIMQRNKAQENLFKSGQVDFFDPFMEKKILSAAYQKPKNVGDAPLKPKWRAFFEEHREKSRDLDRGDFYYNPRRLNELTTGEDNQIQDVVSWLSKGLVLGSISQRLELLSEQMIAIKSQEKKATDAESNDGADTHLDPLARRKFERFLDDVIVDARQSHIEEWTEAESQRLSRLLSLIAEDREHDFVRQRALAFLAKSPTVHAGMALSARLVREEDAPGLLGITADAARDWGFKRQKRQEDRTLAAEQLIKLWMDSGIEDRSEAKNFAILAHAVRGYILADRGGRVISVSQPLDLIPTN